MSGTAAAVAGGPQLPGSMRDVLRLYGEAHTAGQLERAISVLDDALSGIRAEPSSTPFMARVQLALMLADAYLDAGSRERARRLLLDESVYCDMIVQTLALNGTPEQRRTAMAGRMQVRDRAAQVELLGEEAPEITVSDWTSGEPASLEMLRGQVVLLEFWATWCRPCLEMFPRLRDLHSRFAARGLSILALTRYASTPPDADVAAAHTRERELVQTVISERGLEMRVGIAPDGRLQSRYGANGVPTLVLIDRAGRVRLIASGGDDAALEAEIVRCLDESSE
jgi:thiol-disulfide isomerase/thioredoxin